MLSKETSLLLAASSSFLSRIPSTASSTSSTFRTKHNGNTRPYRHSIPVDRHRYATAADESPLKGSTTSEHVWPTPPKGHACPTPYQIFDMKHQEQYTKTRFYELVKIYHPDLKTASTSQDDSQLSEQDKMERYRLIVAANAVLSDPAKRRAYDRFGAGWAGRSDFGIKSEYRKGASTAPFSQSWTQPHDPIWQNATWEDWEKFYAARARDADPNAPSEPQTPLYLSNSWFIALVGLLAVMGSLANYTRAQDAGTYFIEQRDLVHDRASKELRKVRQETASRGREERIQWFLRQREATRGTDTLDSELESIRDEKARRVLPDAELCRASDLSENT